MKKLIEINKDIIQPLADKENRSLKNWIENLIEKEAKSEKVKILEIDITNNLLGLELELIFDDYEQKRFVIHEHWIETRDFDVFVSMEVEANYIEDLFENEFKEASREYIDEDNVQVFSKDGEPLKIKAVADWNKVLNNLTLNF